MIREPKRKLPDPNAAWIDVKSGRPTREFYQYLSEVDAALRALMVLANDLEIRVTELEMP